MNSNILLTAMIKLVLIKIYSLVIATACLSCESVSLVFPCSGRASGSIAKLL